MSEVMITATFHVYMARDILLSPNLILNKSANRVRAPFHESNIRLYKTKIMTENKTL